MVGDDGRMLLIRRGTEPARGTWSVPGGRKEPGESDPEATVREVREETGLEVVVADLLGIVERDAPDGSVYVIRDFACRLADGADPAALRAGDDADDAAWFEPDQVRRLRTAPGLVDSLDAWGLLTPPPAPRGSSSRG